MSTEIATITPKMAAVSPEYQEIMMLGNVLFQSGYFKDVRDQAQAVTKILFGRELGFSPIVSMGGIHIIEGKPALSSNLMATLIKRSGKYDYRVTTWNPTTCVLMFREKVGGKWEEVGESSFTIDDAKQAGVLRQGGSWTKYPRPMLFARALSQGLRTYCPDVSASPIYNPEEMGAEVNGDGEVTQLPKSASNVERTTAPIPIKNSAAINKDQGGKPQEGPGPSAAADKNSTAETAPAGGRDGAVANTPVSPSSVVEYISQGQAVNFQRSFKEALPEAYRLKVKDIAHAWLEAKGCVGLDGKPTAKAIHANGFADMKAAAVEYAKGYSEAPLVQASFEEELEKPPLIDPELAAKKWFIRIEQAPTVDMLKEAGLLLAQTDDPLTDDHRKTARALYGARMKQLKDGLDKPLIQEPPKPTGEEPWI